MENDQKSILLRLDAETAKEIDDVHYGLRFKSRTEAIKAMLRAGAKELLKGRKK
jgi:hypothetical protein